MKTYIVLCGEKIFLEQTNKGKNFLEKIINITNIKMMFSIAKKLKKDYHGSRNCYKNVNINWKNFFWKLREKFHKLLYISK